MKYKSNILNKFTNCIYNINEFPKYILDGIGKAILYALILSFFIGGVKGIVRYINLNSYLEDGIDSLKEEKYSFSITNNKLDIRESPIKIEDSGTLFYVDDNLQLSNINTLRSLIVNSDMSIIVANDGIYVKSNEINTQGEYSIYYSELNLEGINNAKIVNLIEEMRLSLFIILVLFSIVYEFILYIMSAFLIAVLTIIPSRLWGINFEFSHLFALVIYAYTLPNLLVLVLNIIIPNVIFDTAGMVGAVMYTYLALRNMKNKINKKVV